ncbi:thiol reductant ABC exporter subunit CydC [Roseibium polysiphoniae]|uniref:Thiol reductant ABC exporter subunit CydC n=1 Tax=Roseibium polysiphoniae TaxID=2571221 RepID=A0A944CAB4_9HYPH|nr:thiol reductant ABC exporter subunit CydC [Roseibium polysiphoniae]MBS8258857.1 thiol reductant ABC exporter subunit CydC [Roseibium polysiphoniae]
MSGLAKLIKWQWSHHRTAFAGGILVALIPAIAGIALLGVAGWFITAAALAGMSGAFLNIFLPSAAIRGLAIARTAGRYGERLLTHDATFRFLTDLRCRIFEGQAHRAGNGAKPRSGPALNRLTSDITALDAVYLRLVVPGILAGAVGLLSVAWIVSISLVLAIGPVVLLVFIAGLSVHLMTRKKRRDARRQEAALDAVRLRTVDLVAGRRDLAVYGGLEAAAGTIRSAEYRLADAEEAIEARSSLLSACTGFAGQVALAPTLAAIIWTVGEGGVAIAVAVAVLLVVLGLPEVVSMIIPGLSKLDRTRLAAHRAVEGVEPNGAGLRSQGPAVQNVADGGQQKQGQAALTFECVSFGYPAAERQVLEDLSFEIAPGEWLALVGRSGCGKSTVSALASALLRPDGGSIQLGGQGLDAIREEELRRRITVLGQKPYLFHDSVAANLRIANPQASDSELWQALEVAALKDRISDNTSGLQAMLGEGGVGLSGGEQRRLGLARAYLTQPDLFILDELTEGLDEVTATQVLDGFQRFRGDAAVLMIAHKQTEIDRADRILRLDAADQPMAAAAHRR